MPPYPSLIPRLRSLPDAFHDLRDPGVATGLLPIVGIVLASFSLPAWAQSTLRSDGQGSHREATVTPASFATENLIAWCLVPFDAKKRTPERRARMVAELGLKRVAYDWRPEHVAEFEREIRAYQANGLQMFAFWDWHEALRPLIHRYDIRPQIWSWYRQAKQPDAEDPIEHAIAQLSERIEITHDLGLKLGLYNHGGWSGEPETLVAICQRLRDDHGMDHVGIVYNLHHAHGRMASFAEDLALMKPHLLCLNINGMVSPESSDITQQGNKIRAVGSCANDATWMRVVLNSGYAGPIGILDHRHDLDTEVALRRNLAGLRDLLQQRTDTE
ncbi:MAG: hypothetical protein AAGD07_20235 [Planctomycetota bacterium]